MTPGLLTRKPSSLFAAIGGWRTVAEVIASRVLFLIAYLLTARVLTSALIAVGGVAICALIRAFADRRYWQAAGGLIAVAVSAALAGGTGHSVNFYLPGVLLNIVGTAAFALSILVRQPLIGLILAPALGERSSWRQDRPRRRRYTLCTTIFLAKFATAAAIMVLLYLTKQLIPLALADTLLGIPALAVSTYLTWRILEPPTEIARSAGQALVEVGDRVE